MTAVQRAYSRNLLALAGVGRPAASTGRHPVELLTATQPPAAEERIAQAVTILQSHRDDEAARAAAFKALTGAELLVLVDEVPC